MAVNAICISLTAPIIANIGNSREIFTLSIINLAYDSLPIGEDPYVEDGKEQDDVPSL
jgi:hypothetical protein